MTSDDDRIGYLGTGEGAVSGDERIRLDAIRASLADPDLWAEPPAELGERVVAALVEAQREDVRDTETRVTETRGEPEPIVDLASERSGRRGWMLAAAAAAALAIVAVGALVIGRSESTETFAFALDPDESVAGVSGSVTASKSDSGWRIELDVDGLERLADGEFYEAWLRDDDGTLVPVGTFNEGTDVVLWAGVPISEFSIFSVTAEAADGDQSSSGRRVLIATLDDQVLGP